MLPWPWCLSQHSKETNTDVVVYGVQTDHLKQPGWLRATKSSSLAEVQLDRARADRAHLTRALTRILFTGAAGIGRAWPQSQLKHSGRVICIPQFEADADPN